VTEPLLRGLRNRLLQVLALHAPGGGTLRVLLHRRRGVQIGERVFIGVDAIIETTYPHLVAIEDGVDLGMRTTIIAHQVGEPVDETKPSVRIEANAFVGPGTLILPNVTIGRGAVVNAGSVVKRSVPPLTMVQGNPARPVARCGMPLLRDTRLKDFYKALRPIKSPEPRVVR
jgi:acetyltransferase-like isoleucine patch superfamily enzyme